MGFGAPTTLAGGAYIRPATLVIAASDSKDKTDVDYVCDGTDDQAEINAAIGALPAGGGMVVLLEGTYSITDSINLASNVTFVGQGAGTVLRVPNGHDANLNVISASAVDHILISNLRVDGNKANQTAGTMHGIYFDTVTHSEILGCWVENLANDGIHLISSDNNILDGNVVLQGTDAGVYLHLSDNNVITSNNLQGDPAQPSLGLQISSSSNNTISSNNVQGSGGHGIYLSSSGHNTIVDNMVTNNSQRTDNAYDGINLGWDCDYNNIQGNTVRHGGGANQHRYGIRINFVSCDGNLVTNNGLYLAGRTANFSDAGTGTTQDVVKEVFLPAYGHTDGARSHLGSYSTVTFADAGSFACYFTLKVPRDFASFVRVEAVWTCAAAAGDMNWSLESTHGASGELYDVHIDIPGYGTTATGGANIINVQQPANPLTLADLARGDHIGIRFSRDAVDLADTLNADVHLLGLLFTYRTDE